MQINLLPPEMKQRRRRALLRALGTVAILAVLGLAVHMVWSEWMRLDDARLLLASLEAEYKGYEGVLRLDHELKALQDRLRAATDFVDRSTPPEPVSTLLSFVAGAVPNRLHVESLDVDGQKISITGYAADLSSVAEFLVNIRRGGRLVDVDLDLPLRFAIEDSKDRVYFVITATWKAAG